MIEEVNISNLSHDSGNGLRITSRDEFSSRKYFLADKTIGISISVSDNLGELGYGELHQKDAMIEVARYVLALGGRLSYGGDLRPQGFTELLFELLAYYKADKALQPNERFLSYLAYPISTMLSEEQETSLIQNVTFIKIDPPSDIETIEAKELLENSTPENLYQWARCLTKMREEMESNCDARIFIGGAIRKFKGKCPGILEELLIALRHNHPVYLVGSFGGITLKAIEALKGNTPDCFSVEFYGENADYMKAISVYNDKHPEDTIDYEKYLAILRSIGMKGIAKFNGLSEEDNIRLTITPHISEAVYLILKGLTNCFAK
jgi:SLOG cluster2